MKNACIWRFPRIAQVHGIVSWMITMNGIQDNIVPLHKVLSCMYYSMDVAMFVNAMPKIIQPAVLLPIKEMKFMPRK